MNKIYVMALLILIHLTNIDAVEYNVHVGTNSSSWSIDRQSQTLNFDLTGSVNGQISPIGYRGGNLMPYGSFFANMKENDVEFRERTSALKGSYQANENVELRSNVSNDEINIYVNKPVGSDVYTISIQEPWPAFLLVDRGINYSGEQINDRDLQVNNQDFVRANLLYNKVLKKNLRARMWLEKMNATVLSTNENIISANLYPNKFLDYGLDIRTTGIADLRYRQSSTLFNTKRQTYFPTGESRETYFGAYNISRKMHMELIYDNTSLTDDYEWLPRCTDSSLSDQNGANIGESSNHSGILADKENSAEYWFNEALSLMKSGNYSEAVAAYEKVINKTYSNATAWNQKGVALALMGRYNDSIVTFEKAVDINPQYDVAWYNRGASLAKVGRYEEALSAYDKAINITPQEPGFWHAKGTVLLALHRTAESEAAFAKAKEIAQS